MLRITALNIDSLRETDLEAAFSLLSPEKQEKVKRYRFEKDRIRGIMGETLVRYALCAFFGLPADGISFGIGENGRPFLQKPEKTDLDFNLSHAGSWVVCAVGDGRVGIDVEQIRDDATKIAPAVLTPDELDSWRALPESERRNLFFRLWTLKESYSKFTGLGLGQGFETVRTHWEKENEWSVVSDSACALYARPLGPDCWLSVCVNRDKRTDEAEKIHFADLRDINRVLTRASAN